MTLISLRLDLISHCLPRDIWHVTWPSYSDAPHTTSPKVASVIKAPLRHNFHTNTESSDFIRSEMFARDATYTGREHPTSFRNGSLCKQKAFQASRFRTWKGQQGIVTQLCQKINILRANLYTSNCNNLLQLIITQYIIYCHLKHC